MDALQFAYATAQSTILELFVFVVPMILFAILFRLLGRLIEVRLIRRFGWNSILATAWLGTPIHELSHVAMCLVFGHTIKEVALFRPDRKAMRLGYVTHAYNPRNPWQLTGQFFIGFAPLAAGSALIYGLALLFYQDAISLSDGDAIRDLATINENSMAYLPTRVFASVREIVNLANLATLRFWVFLYLVLCIGGHMSPSASDYEQTHWGALAMLVALVIANAIAIGVGNKPTWLLEPASVVMVPLFAALMICLLLFAVVAAVVVVSTSIWDVFTQP